MNKPTRRKTETRPRISLVLFNITGFMLSVYFSTFMRTYLSNWDYMWI
jgi:hypothetical protein